MLSALTDCLPSFSGAVSYCANSALSRGACSFAWSDRVLLRGGGWLTLLELFLREVLPTTAEEAKSLVAAMKPGGGLDSSKSLDRLRTLYEILDATDGRLGRDSEDGEEGASAGEVGLLAPSDSAMMMTGTSKNVLGIM